MARRVILVASADDARLDRWLSLVRQAGYLPLPATSITRVFALLRKVRPALVLTDAVFPDGDASDLQEDMRAVNAQANVPLIVTGAAMDRVSFDLSRDKLTTLHEGDDDTSIQTLLEQVLGGPRPQRPRPHSP